MGSGDGSGGVRHAFAGDGLTRLQLEKRVAWNDVRCGTWLESRPLWDEMSTDGSTWSWACCLSVMFTVLLRPGIVAGMGLRESGGGGYSAALRSFCFSYWRWLSLLISRSFSSGISVEKALDGWFARSIGR